MCIRDRYIAALENGVLTVEEGITFLESAEGKAKFGDNAASMLEHMKLSLIHISPAAGPPCRAAPPPAQAVQSPDRYNPRPVPGKGPPR